MQAKTTRRITLAVVVLAVAVTAAIGAARHSSSPAPTLGVATGEYVDGVPVYRLPTVNVTVSRQAELAKMAQEEAVAMK